MVALGACKIKIAVKHNFNSKLTSSTNSQPTDIEFMENVRSKRNPRTGPIGVRGQSRFFIALDVLSRKVIEEFGGEHKATDYIPFLKRVDQQPWRKRVRR